MKTTLCLIDHGDPTCSFLHKVQGKLSPLRYKESGTFVTSSEGPRGGGFVTVKDKEGEIVLLSLSQLSTVGQSNYGERYPDTPCHRTGQ